MTVHRYPDGTPDYRTVEEVTAQARKRLELAGMPLRQNPHFEAHDHLRGVEGCPTCSRHDHSIVEPYGFTELTQVATKRNAEGERVERHTLLPVPGYHFECEVCRGDDLTGVALTCDRWTAAGARFRREHPELFPGQLPLIMDGDLDPNGAF